MKASKLLIIMLLVMMLGVFLAGTAEAAVTDKVGDFFDKFKDSKIGIIIINSIVIFIGLFLIQAVSGIGKGDDKQKTMIYVIIGVLSIGLAIMYFKDVLVWKKGIFGLIFHMKVLVNIGVVSGVLLLLKGLFLKGKLDAPETKVGAILLIIFLAGIVAFMPLQPIKEGDKIKEWTKEIEEDYPYVWQYEQVVVWRAKFFGNPKCLALDYQPEKKFALFNVPGGFFFHKGCYTAKDIEDMKEGTPLENPNIAGKTVISMPNANEMQEIIGFGLLRSTQLWAVVCMVLGTFWLFTSLIKMEGGAETKWINWLIAGLVGLGSGSDGINILHAAIYLQIIGILVLSKGFGAKMPDSFNVMGIIQSILPIVLGVLVVGSTVSVAFPCYSVIKVGWFTNMDNQACEAKFNMCATDDAGKAVERLGEDVKEEDCVGDDCPVEEKTCVRQTEYQGTTYSADIFDQVMKDRLGDTEEEEKKIEEEKKAKGFWGTWYSHITEFKWKGGFTGWFAVIMTIAFAVQLDYLRKKVVSKTKFLGISKVHEWFKGGEKNSGKAFVKYAMLGVIIFFVLPIMIWFYNASTWTQVLINVAIMLVGGYAVFADKLYDEEQSLKTKALNAWKRHVNGWKSKYVAAQILGRPWDLKESIPKGEFAESLRRLNVELQTFMNYMLRLEVFKYKMGTVWNQEVMATKIYGTFEAHDTFEKVREEFRVNKDGTGYVYHMDDYIETRTEVLSYTGDDGNPVELWQGAPTPKIGISNTWIPLVQAFKGLSSLKKNKKIDTDKIEREKGEAVKTRDMVSKAVIELGNMRTDFNAFLKSDKQMGLYNIIEHDRIETLDNYIMQGQWEHSYRFGKSASKPLVYLMEVSTGKTSEEGEGVFHKVDRESAICLGFEDDKLGSEVEEKRMPYEVSYEGWVLKDLNDAKFAGRITTGPYKGQRFMDKLSKDVPNPAGKYVKVRRVKNVNYSTQQSDMYDRKYDSITKWLHIEWKGYFKNLTQGLYSPNSLVAQNYRDKFKLKPRIEKPTFDGTVKSVLTWGPSQIKEIFSWRREFNLDNDLKNNPENSIKREGYGEKDPTFDREALKDPGYDSYWGKEEYWSDDLNELNKNFDRPGIEPPHPNCPFPHISCKGLGEYIKTYLGAVIDKDDIAEINRQLRMFSWADAPSADSKGTARSFGFDEVVVPKKGEEEDK